jgi:predicted extracellular nuclease
MKNVKKCLFPLVFSLFSLTSCLFLLGSCDTQQKSIVVKSATTPPDFSRPLSFQDAKDSFRLAFYNVENLFDTIDSPNTLDSEYMPNSSLKWQTQRYFAKQKNIAKVVEAMNFPTIMGMAEVENHRVLEDLIAQPALASKILKAQMNAVLMSQ